MDFHLFVLNVIVILSAIIALYLSWVAYSGPHRDNTGCPQLSIITIIALICRCQINESLFSTCMLTIVLLIVSILFYLTILSMYDSVINSIYNTGYDYGARDRDKFDVKEQ
jgi:hypothetical protein